MSQDEWIPTLKDSEVLEDAVTLAFPKGISILLLRKAGQIYALRNRCAHMSCTLSGGRLDGYVLRCPCHEWRFNIRTGEFIDAPELRIPTYPLKTEAGRIFIRLDEVNV